MNENKKRNIIIGLVGFLLLIIAGFLKGDNISTRMFLYDICLNSSFILITVVVLSFIWDLLGGEPIENLLNMLWKSVTLLKNSKETGLCDIYTNSGEIFNKSAIAFWKTGKKNINIMDYSMAFPLMVPEFEETIRKLLKKGTRIRILTMDYSNPHFLSIIDPHLKTHSPEMLIQYISSSERLFEKLAEEKILYNYKGTIEFCKVKDGLILSLITNADSKMMVIPYMYTCNTQDNPLLIIEGENSSLYQKYISEFNELWKRNIKL